MAQLVGSPTLGFSSDHMVVVGSSPALGSALGMESALNSLSLSLPLCPLCACAQSLSLSSFSLQISK